MGYFRVEWPIILGYLAFQVRPTRCVAAWVGASPVERAPTHPLMASRTEPSRAAVGEPAIKTTFPQKPRPYVWASIAVSTTVIYCS